MLLNIAHPPQSAPCTRPWLLHPRRHLPVIYRPRSHKPCRHCQPLSYARRQCNLRRQDIPRLRDYLRVPVSTRGKLTGWLFKIGTCCFALDSCRLLLAGLLATTSLASRRRRSSSTAHCSTFLRALTVYAQPIPFSQPHSSIDPNAGSPDFKTSCPVCNMS